MRSLSEKNCDSEQINIEITPPPAAANSIIAGSMASRVGVVVQIRPIDATTPTHFHVK